MKIFLVLAAFLFATSAHAIPFGRMPEGEIRAADYMRSCTPLAGFGFVASSTSGEYLLDANDDPVLLRWGTQIEVTCTSATGTHGALVVLHMAPPLEPLGGTSVGWADGECGAGCGWYDDTAGPTGKAGPIPSFLVKSGATKYRRIARGPYNSSAGSGEEVVTSRAGKCTTVEADSNSIGGPCDEDSECGTGGVCDEDSFPSGVFMTIFVSDTSLSCFVELCI